MLKANIDEPVAAEVPPAAAAGPLYVPQDDEQPAANTSGTTDPERIELFELNGVSYTVPKAPGPAVALRYMRDVRRHGKEHAIAGIMAAMLGEDALDALADYDDLTEENLEQVMAAVQKHVMGPLEKRSGKR